jgi:hypothetical protein
VPLILGPAGIIVGFNVSEGCPGRANADGTNCGELLSRLQQRAGLGEAIGCMLACSNTG